MEDSIFRISEKEEKELFKKGHVVFDSSALLSFYGYTDKISEEFFNKVFKALKNRLWLPAQVIYEFEKNREKVISKPKGEYLNLLSADGRKEGGFIDSVKTAIGSIRKNSETIHGQINALTEKTKKDDKHPHISQESIKSFINDLDEFKSHIESLSEGFVKLSTNTQEQINQKIKEIDEKSTNDNFRERLNTFFTHGTPYPYETVSSPKNSTV